MADAMAEPQSRSWKGLTESEARQRLQKYGPMFSRRVKS